MNAVSPLLTWDFVPWSQPNGHPVWRFSLFYSLSPWECHDIFQQGWNFWT